ncbi:guanylate kinase [Verrucomicrobiota bacterium]|jgi:guanylate kinase|nr:guanylate kinase [Verrucomicrobiota bacterium]
MNRSGILFLISAPSGGGKSTLLKLLSEKPDFTYSVSCTTRAPRPGEEDGRDYHFLSVAEFERRIAAGEFIEHAQVHGNFYGTLRRPILDSMDSGLDVMMDVDIQGAARIRADADARLQAALVDIFLMPPSLAEVRRRLLKRGTETPGQLEVRLRNAETEMAQWKNYRYTILSGTPMQDFENFRAIMQAERMRSSRMLVTF